MPSIGGLSFHGASWRKITKSPQIDNHYPLFFIFFYKTIPFAVCRIIRTFVGQTTIPMTSVIYYLLSIILYLISVADARAAEQSRMHQQWLALPSEQLMQMGDHDSADGGTKDSALVCYNIVVHRYDPA